MFLTVLLLALSFSASPASSATTASKALRFTVVKRVSTSVVVRRGSVRLTLRRGDPYARIGDIRRYRVLKRARDYCLLMPLISVTSCGAEGNGNADDTAAIAETMRTAARAGKGV